MAWDEVAVVVPVTGVVLTVAWNALKHRFDLRSQLAHDRLAAYSDLLSALHLLNNAHSLEDEASGPSHDELVRARDLRDEVWHAQSRILLVAPKETREHADALVKEYQSSSPDRRDRRCIDRKERKRLRIAFIDAARRDLPGANRRRLW